MAIYGVMRFCNLLRVGISWKGPEVIELWSRKVLGEEEDDDEIFDSDSDCSLLVRVSSSGSGFSSNSDFVWQTRCSRG